METFEVLKKQLLTEKSMLMRDKQNRYSFAVAKNANKTDIRHAIEKQFKVKVEKVCTLIVEGKTRKMGRFSGQRPDWKKAIVTLAAGQKIDTAASA